MSRARRLPDGTLAVSLLLMALGCSLLLRTTGAVETAFFIIPFLFVCAGVLVIVYTLRRSFYARALAAGVFLVLCGCLLFLGQALGWQLKTYWPLFLAALGLAILAAGLRKHKSLKAGYGVMGVLFVVLSAVFSIFSFGSVTLSFRVFLREWWPSLILFGGLFLFALYFWNRKRFGSGK